VSFLTAHRGLVLCGWDHDTNSTNYRFMATSIVKNDCAMKIKKTGIKLLLARRLVLSKLEDRRICTQDTLKRRLR